MRIGLDGYAWAHAARAAASAAAATQRDSIDRFIALRSDLVGNRELLGEQLLEREPRWQTPCSNANARNASSVRRFGSTPYGHGSSPKMRRVRAT